MIKCVSSCCIFQTYRTNNALVEILGRPGDEMPDESVQDHGIQKDLDFGIIEPVFEMWFTIVLGVTVIKPQSETKNRSTSNQTAYSFLFQMSVAEGSSGILVGDFDFYLWVVSSRISRRER